MMYKELRIRDRSAFLDRTLLQALFWSLIFHLMLFSVFRIRLYDFKQEGQPIAPINVSLEQEEHGPITEVTSHDLIDIQGLLSQNIDKDEWLQMAFEQSMAPEMESQGAPRQEKDLIPRYANALSTTDIASMLKKPNFSPKVYPLHLKLSKPLKKLTLIEDGSCLFREKLASDDTKRIALSNKRLPIEYTVTVMGATGRLENVFRKYELLDKELQECADLIIKKIQFAPFSLESVTGTLTLSFVLDGSEVKALMKGQAR